MAEMYKDISLRQLCASTAKSKAAICEHASPSSTIHVQKATSI